MAMMAIAALSCGASTVEYSGAAHSSPEQGVGTGYAGIYDVAMYLDGNVFADCKVTGVNVPMVSPLEGSEVSIWVASDLKLADGRCVADLYMEKATVVDGKAVHKLDYPVTIPASGLYVGYSFSVDRADDDVMADPVIVRDAHADGGLFIHSSSIFTSWTDLTHRRKLASAMSVTLDGNFADADMAVKLDEEELNVPLDARFVEIPLTVVNLGESSASELELAYNDDKGSLAGRLLYNVEETMLYGQPYVVTASFENTFAKGYNDIGISLEAINGIPNMNQNKAVSASVFCYDEVIRKRPLLEEYTGLWCNYCPKGFAALEYMDREHPDDFIGVSFHYNDAMTVTERFPSDVPSYPYAYLDRDWSVDPYYGRSFEGTIEDDWKERSLLFTPADIDARASIEGGGKINVDVDLKFIKPLRGGYRVFYYLLADGLSDPRWLQKNAFGGYDPSDFSMPDMEVFCNGGVRVSGLTFNDVVVMLSDPLGDTAYTEVVPGTHYAHHYVFDTSEPPSETVAALIGKASSLSVVAGVVDGEARLVLNAVKCKVEGFAFTEMMYGDRCVSGCEYFDMNGHRVGRDVPGLKIRRILYSDGTVTVDKTVL